MVAELFSINLANDAHAGLGLDDRQEVSNGLLKTITKTISSSALPKLAPVAQLREVAQFDCEDRDTKDGGGESDGGEEADGNASGGGTASGGITLIDSLRRDDSGVLEWISSDYRVTPTLTTYRLPIGK